MSETEYLIEGERVALGPLRRDLAETYARWMNSVEVRHGLSHPGIFDRTTEEAWLEETIGANAKHVPERADFTIHDRRDGAAVGTCALVDVSHHHLRARFGIARSASAAARGSAARPRG